MKQILAAAAAFLLFPMACTAAQDPEPADSAQVAQAPARVSAYPSPGTITASPATRIAFRGRGENLGRIRVTGSRSGRHEGRLRRHSDGEGVSFIPSRRFRRGERVTVRTGVPIVGGRNGDFSFRIGRMAHPRIQSPDPRRLPPGPLRDFLLSEDIPPGRLMDFRSRPDLRPPIVTVDPDPGARAPGFVFLSPKSKKDLKQAGPMIVDDTGEPIYFRPLPGIRAATDFRAQTYRGKPVLTYWVGTSRQGIGVGRLVMLDQSYRRIATIKAPNGFRPDLHEFEITPQGTAVFIAYPSFRTNLRPVGGPRRGLAVDSVLLEVDIATGLVIFEWHSLGKIRLRETFSKPQPSPEAPFDYAHANSVKLDSDGDFLMSARNTWGVYKIDRESGRIIWRLGGKRSSFKLGRGVKFAWQHDAQRRADGAITLFDNSAFPPVRKRSRAIAIRLDEDERRATLLSAHTHPGGLLAATQGNHQTLPGGHSMVGWGSQRYFSEHGPDGKVVWNARVSLGFETYRAYRMPWVGTPLTRPRVAGRLRKDSTAVFASWNGATEVASWEVLGGPSADALQPVGSGRKAGFETRLVVPGRFRWVGARALDTSGKVLSEAPPRRAG